VKTARAARADADDAMSVVGVSCVAPPVSPGGVVPPSGFAHESQTRAAVVRLLLEKGPVTATQLGSELGLSAAGVRRHLDALMELGDAEIAPNAAWRHRGRGRPAKRFQLTPAGRAQLRHAYDDLATAALRQLREIGGESAVEEFARRRIEAIVGPVERAVSGAESGGDAPAEQIADRIADALTAAGFAASTSRVGNGVEICQHHCPVSFVAAEFPQLCEAEERAFERLLGTHVQRLATIANGNCACTTHVPLVQLGMPGRNAEPDAQRSTDLGSPALPDRTAPSATPTAPAAQPVAENTSLRKEPA
jgi:predicted ArsR family transcriptional regulator